MKNFFKKLFKSSSITDKENNIEEDDKKILRRISFLRSYLEVMKKSNLNLEDYRNLIIAENKFIENKDKEESKKIIEKLFEKYYKELS